MKRVIVLLAISLSTSAFAGMTYQIESNSTGLRSASITGKVAVDGARMRMDVITGDHMLFNDNTLVLSNDGGRTMSVFDPSTRNYFELNLEDALGSATSVLRNLPGSVKVSFENPNVSVRDAGDGGTVQGYPTRRYLLDASYDVVVDAMGQKMTSHTKMTTESWATQVLSSESTNFLQLRAFRTGIEALDKLIQAQSDTIKGMPLKQVSTITVNQGAGDITMSTTSLVTNIERKAIDASQFTIPSGYTKVDDPITKMMKQFKQ